MLESLFYIFLYPSLSAFFFLHIFILLVSFFIFTSQTCCYCRHFHTFHFTFAVVLPLLLFVGAWLRIMCVLWGDGSFAILTYIISRLNLKFRFEMKQFSDSFSSSTESQQPTWWSIFLILNRTLTFLNTFFSAAIQIVYVSRLSLTFFLLVVVVPSLRSNPPHATSHSFRRIAQKWQEIVPLSVYR